MSTNLTDDHGSTERARAALNHLDPNCDRDSWVKYGMCLKHEFGETGFDIWREWSSQSDKYNPRDAKATWKSIRADGKRTIASLFHDAKAVGWKDSSGIQKPTVAEIEAFKATAAERAVKAADREAQTAAAAAKRAQALWDTAAPLEDYGHPYLQRKGVKSYGLRVGRWERLDADTGEWITTTQNGLLIPMRDRRRRLWSLQCILPDTSGRKMYLKDGAKRGNFFPIGKPQTVDGQTIFVLAEGYATAASVHAATGHLVLVCFDVSNLAAVARSIRERSPKAVIIFAADNDNKTAGNPGVTLAKAAAREVGGLVAVPPPGDFNDLQLAEGLDAVANCILEATLEPPQTDRQPVGNSGQKLELRCKNESQFGDPVDLFNVDPAPQIPLDTLPAAIANFAKDQAELMGCDHSIFAMTALVAAASCLHDGVQIQPKRHDPTWRESARLWVAVVGSPSSKKSPAIGKAIFPIRKIDTFRREQSRGELSQWDMLHAAKKKSSKDDTSRESSVPDRPPMRRAIVEDTTIEAMSEILKDNPQGVLCVRDELTGWLGSMDAYKGSKAGASADRANWLELYNGGPRNVDRLVRGSVSIQNWSACLIGGIQPDMLRRVVAGMGHDGLLQRFLPVIACSADSIGVDRVPDMLAIERYRELLEQLAGVLPTKEPVQLEEEAQIVRERVDLLAQKMARAVGHDGLEAWLGKWSGMFARLLLTFHAIECAQSRVHPSTRRVSGVAAEMVERLLCRTMLRHGIKFYGEIIDVNERHQRGKELARLILAKQWDVVHKRELQRNWKATSKMQPWELHEVIGRLCDMDWLQPDREAEPGADGKPRRWFVNPAVHEIFASHAKVERQRRADVVETLRELKAAHKSEP